MRAGADVLKYRALNGGLWLRAAWHLRSPRGQIFLNAHRQISRDLSWSLAALDGYGDFLGQRALGNRMRVAIDLAKLGLPIGVALDNQDAETLHASAPSATIPCVRYRAISLCGPLCLHSHRLCGHAARTTTRDWYCDVVAQAMIERQHVTIGWTNPGVPKWVLLSSSGAVFMHALPLPTDTGQV